MDNYEEELRRARFCLAPYGAGWGIRLSLSMAYGCVPVIIQDFVYQVGCGGSAGQLQQRVPGRPRAAVQSPQWASACFLLAVARLAAATHTLEGGPRPGAAPPVGRHPSLPFCRRRPAAVRGPAAVPGVLGQAAGGGHPAHRRHPARCGQRGVREAAGKPAQVLSCLRVGPAVRRPCLQLHDSLAAAAVAAAGGGGRGHAEASQGSHRGGCIARGANYIRVISSSQHSNLQRHGAGSDNHMRTLLIPAVCHALRIIIDPRAHCCPSLEAEAESCNGSTTGHPWPRLGICCVRARYDSNT